MADGKLMATTEFGIDAIKRGRVKSNFGSASVFSVIFPFLPLNSEKYHFVGINPLCRPTIFQIRFYSANKRSLPVAIFCFSGNILP